MNQLLPLFLSIFLCVACQNKSKQHQFKENKQEKITTPLQESGTVLDIEGNVYRYLEMCDNKEWMIENLNVSHYNNGDEIPQVQDPEEWAQLKTGAWCYYLNDAAYGTVYGKLYNWYAVNDKRGLAPEGWHVSTKEDWGVFMQCLGGENLAATKLKEIGTFHWLSPNLGANNLSGFTALPGGGRSSKGAFTLVDNLGLFWINNQYDDLHAWIRHLSYSNTYVVEFYNDKRSGFSVRCVRD